MLPHAIPLRRRLRSHANYVRFSFHAGAGLQEQIAMAPSKTVWIAVLPLGLALYIRDRRRFPEISPATG